MYSNLYVDDMLVLCPSMMLGLQAAWYAGFVCRFRCGAMMLSLTKFSILPNQYVWLQILCSFEAYANASWSSFNPLSYFFQVPRFTFVGGKPARRYLLISLRLKELFFMSANCIYAKKKFAEEIFYLTLQLTREIQSSESIYIYTNSNLCNCIY
jgi:hypothetical protein